MSHFLRCGPGWKSGFIFVLSLQLTIVRNSPCQSPCLDLTIVQVADQADAIFLATACNPVHTKDDRYGTPIGTTEFQVSRVIKSHRGVVANSSIQFPIFIKNATTPIEYIVFAREIEGTLYPGPLVDKSIPALAKYLAELTHPSRRALAARIVFLLDQLDHADGIISYDAERTLASYSMHQFKDIDARLDYEKLFLKMQQPELAKLQETLGVIIGLSKRAEFAPLMRNRIEKRPNEPEKITGYLIGYCILNENDGRELVYSLVNGKDVDSQYRQQALYVVGFLINQFKLPAQEVLRKTTAALNSPDVAIGLVNLLRTHEVWDFDHQIFEMYATADKQNALRHSVVKYALCCPTDAAKAFVQRVREAEPSLLKDMEEKLKFERKHSSLTEEGSG